LENGIDKLSRHNNWLKSKIDAFSQAVTKPVAVRSKRGMANIDLKQWVEDLVPSGEDGLEMAAKMSGSKTVRPSDILKAVFDLSQDELQRARVKKIGVRFVQAP
jgi:hypothetical protein